MNSIKDRAAQIQAAAARMGKETFKGTADKNTMARTELTAQGAKVVTLEEAIRKSGLQDGMTISFHHRQPTGAWSYRRLK